MYIWPWIIWVTQIEVKTCCCFISLQEKGIVSYDSVSDELVNECRQWMKVKERKNQSIAIIITLIFLSRWNWHWMKVKVQKNESIAIIIMLIILSNHHHRYHFDNLVKVKSVFLQWMPWMLRMSRPGKKITRKVSS